MISFKKNCLLIVLILIVTGCIKNIPTIQTPDIGVSESEINKLFRVEAPPGWNTFKVGDFISVLVEVTVDNEIYFQVDECKIFLFENSTWKEIPYVYSEPKGYNFILSNS